MSLNLIRWLMLALLLAANAGGESKGPSATDLQALHGIGVEIARAMLEKDVSALLKYDMDSLRDEHGRDLQDPKSDLYCYVFDTTCPALHEKKNRSVYSQMKEMKAPGVTVKNLGSNAGSHNSYLLIFYDAARFKAAQVKGASFLCRHAQVDVPIWTFEFRDGSWTAAHPLF